MKVSVLFVRRDSIYKTLGVDCWDIERDARNFPGGNSIVAHPPCRAWGRLRHFSKHTIDEKYLAIKAVNMIRENGGVLEHPRSSKLWQEMNLPQANELDEYGGFTVSLNQHWFGHKAQKKTLLYICGIDRSQLPPMPLNFNAIEFTVGGPNHKHRNKKEITKQEREATPIEFAKWLINVATLCKKI